MVHNEQSNLLLSITLLVLVVMLSPEMKQTSYFQQTKHTKIK